MGLLWMLLAVGFFWSRYRQLADFDYAGSLKEGVAALIAQRRRSLRVEQAVIVGATAAGLVLPRLFNGRGLPDLTRLDILLPLGLALLLASALLVTVQRLHRRDIAELNGLLRQLA